VRVRDAADVQAVVRWAERFDVPLTARSGGHAYHGGSTSRDAVVVDLRALDRVALVDGTTAGGDRTAAGGDRIAAGGGGIAAVGPGARIIDVYAALARRGVTVPAGSCPTVAIGGLMTGGGVGLAGRALGLTLDRVTSLDVVTADGRLRRVDDGDLFWALRGGGGSFGIVTGIRLRVHRVRRAAWFRITYPAASRAEALAAWDDLAPGAPDELTSILVLTAAGATAFGQYLGPERALRRLVAPLRRVPGASASAGTSGYLDLQKRWAGCADGGLPACRRYERSSFAASSAYVARRLSGAGRRALLDAAETGATLILDAYGGAIGRVAPDETAFVHRDVRYSVQILSYAALPVARARVRRARRLVAPYGNGRAYQNYADPDLRGARRAYYGRNYERLVRIKGEVDPANRFRVAQGIRAR
jgi:FAD/FMN-containing dehydrogenase